MAAITAAIIGAGGSLLGGALSSWGSAQSNDMVAPGLSKHTSHDQSVFASQRANQALAAFAAEMKRLEGWAGNNTQQVLGRFRQGAGGLRTRQMADEGFARTATGEAVREYRDFGKHGEDVLREEYARALADADATGAIRRARGGYSSATAAETAGAKGELLYGFNRALSDLTSRRAELVGGAIERGRGQELDVRRGGMDLDRSLLAAELPLMERRFTLPAQFAQHLADTRFNARLRPEFLYPTLNVRRNILGGQGAPNAANQFQPFAESLGAVSGVLSGFGMEDYFRNKYPQQFPPNP